MVRETVNDRVEEVASLVVDEIDCTPEPASDVLVKEFGCRGCGIVSKRFGLYPLCTVVDGDEDVLVACARRGWDERAYEIQPPFLERFQG